MDLNNNKRKSRYTNSIITLCLMCIVVFVITTGCSNIQSNDSNESDNVGNNDEVSMNETVSDEELYQEIQQLLDYDVSSYEIVSEDAEKYTTSFEALDTVIQIIIYNDDPNIDVEEVMNETQELMNEYENLVSKTIEGSFTSTLNEEGVVEYSQSPYREIISELVEKSLYYSELSNGTFDITVEPLVSLWDINGGNTEVPSQEDIDSAREHVDYNNLIYDKEAERYELLNGATVDFGAIAKGQMADIVKASLMSKGINSALINLGGNVMTIGAKPGDKNWVIGIQDPEGDTGDMIATVEVKNKSLVTSGNYERFFIKDGVRYHHILDPKTGYPGNKGLIQTTIIGDSSIDCDALSTTTFLLGAEDGKALIDSLEGYEFMFVTDEDEYVYSDDFETDFNLELMK